MRRRTFRFNGLAVALLAVGIGLACGAALRFGVIEPAHLGWACQSGTPPPWCPLRTLFILIVQASTLGWLALAAAVVAVLGGGRGWVAAGAGVGGAALFLYGAGAASLAVLAALLRGLRLPAVADRG